MITIKNLIILKPKIRSQSSNLNRYDLDTESGRKEFEVEVERFVKLYPGAVCKVGESFDFPAFYARRALANGQDLSKFGNWLM